MDTKTAVREAVDAQLPQLKDEEARNLIPPWLPERYDSDELEAPVAGQGAKSLQVVSDLGGRVDRVAAAARLATRMLWLGALAVIAAGPLDAQPTGRPPGDGPTKVKIQLIVLDLERVTSADQNFTANFAYHARWTDERLRHEGPGQRSMSLIDIWHPRIQVVNQQRIKKTLPDEASVSPEGEVVSTQRFWGQFSQPMQLHDFPFDEQTLSIEIVAAGHEPGTVTLISDPEGPAAVSKSLSISDWQIEAWHAHPFHFTISGAARTLPGFRIELTA